MGKHHRHGHSLGASITRATHCANAPSPSLSHSDPSPLAILFVWTRGPTFKHTMGAAFPMQVAWAMRRVSKQFYLASKLIMQFSLSNDRCLSLNQFYFLFKGLSEATAAAGIVWVKFHFTNLLCDTFTVSCYEHSIYNHNVRSLSLDWACGRDGILAKMSLLPHLCILVNR